MTETSNEQQGHPKVEVSDSLKAFMDVGRTISGMRWIGDKPFAIVPSDTYVADLEAFAQKPARKRSTVSVDRVQSLADYTKQYGGIDGSTMAFASLNDAAIRVLLDYHNPKKNEARWADHRVVYQMTETREWKKWLSMDGRVMPQVEFAEFLEDRMPEIVDPPAADLWTLVTTLEAKRKVNFSSHVRLDDGTAKLTYDEEISTRGGTAKGHVEVPPSITLAIRPFEGMDKWQLQVRLRYRLKEGTLAFFYQIVEPDRVREACFEDQVEKFEQAAGLTCIRGKAHVENSREVDISAPKQF